MKNKPFVYIAALAALTLAGCCSCPQQPKGHCYTVGTHQWSLVNNTGYLLDVFQDGRELGHCGVGQVLPCRFGLFQPDTVVTVVAHTENGQYVGTATHRFYAQENETWQVMSVYAPQGTR